MRFVELETYQGYRVRVNPEQVDYMTALLGHSRKVGEHPEWTELHFGENTLTIAMPMDELVELLQARDE